MSYFSEKQYLDNSYNLLDSKVFYRNFAGIKMLNPVGLSGAQISFSRSSSGTYLDCDGFIKTAAIDTPRFDHSPSGKCLGLLIEAAKTNVALYSEDFTVGFWNKVTCAVSGDVAVSPRGLVDADLLVATSVAANQGSLRQYNITSNPGQYTFSVYAKSGNSNGISLQPNGSVDGNAAGVGALYYFNSGLASSGSQYGGYTLNSVSMTDMGSGWYRCAVTFSFTGSGSQGVWIYPYIGGLDASGAYAYIWGAQYEGSTLSSYIKTDGVAVARSADICQITGDNITKMGYNQNSGTFLAEWILPTGIISNQGLIDAYSDTNNKISLRANAFLANVAGIGQADLPVIGRSGVLIKSAGSYCVNNFQASISGILTSSDNSGILPTVTTIDIGRRDIGGFGAPYLNGYISSISYFNKNYSGDMLRALTRTYEL